MAASTPARPSAAQDTAAAISGERERGPVVVGEEGVEVIVQEMGRRHRHMGTRGAREEEEAGGTLIGGLTAGMERGSSLIPITHPSQQVSQYRKA